MSKDSFDQFLKVRALPPPPRPAAEWSLLRARIEEDEITFFAVLKNSVQRLNFWAPAFVLSAATLAVLWVYAARTASGTPNNTYAADVFRADFHPSGSSALGFEY